MWAPGPGEAEAACRQSNPHLGSSMKTSLVRHQPSPGNKSLAPAPQECLQSALTPEAVGLQSPPSPHTRAALGIWPRAEPQPSTSPLSAVRNVSAGPKGEEGNKPPLPGSEGWQASVPPLVHRSLSSLSCWALQALLPPTKPACSTEPPFLPVPFHLPYHTIIVSITRNALALCFLIPPGGHKVEWKSEKGFM